MSWTAPVRCRQGPVPTRLQAAARASDARLHRCELASDRLDLVAQTVDSSLVFRILSDGADHLRNPLHVRLGGAATGHRGSAKTDAAGHGWLARLAGHSRHAGDDARALQGTGEQLA